MKQIQLKIFEGFDLDGNTEFIWRISNIEGVDWCSNVKKEIIKIIESKTFRIKNCCTEFYKTEESKETIIESLFSYQNEIAPPFTDYKKCLGRIEIYSGEYMAEFYNPETGIITITKFSDNEKHPNCHKQA